MEDRKPVKTYYTTHGYLQRRWQRVGRSMALQAGARATYRRWHDMLSRKLKQLTGYDTMVRAPLKPRILETKDFPDYVRQKILIQTEPGVFMPLFACIPRNSNGPRPAIIAAHGHGSGGKSAVVGDRISPAMNQTIDQYNYDYGIQFCRAGFITFCPDARGFGERQEVMARGDPLGSSCTWLNNMGFPLGQTVTGMWAWDLHRLVDYILTRRDCIPGRIGCVGLSGGGLQTLWATALDTRIKCAVISGYFYGYKESLLDLHGNCSCNYVPHLYEYADIGDIGALIAPRPLLIETGTKDPLNGASGLKNVLPQVEKVRKAYRLFKSAHLLKHDIFEGEHRWNGVAAIPWMVRHMQGREAR